MSDKVSRYLITLLNTGEKFYCREDQHLLKGMTSMGKKGIPSGCHGGGCGVCKVRIVGPASAYKTLSMSREYVSDQEQEKGVVLACRAFPLQQLEIEVIGKLKKNAERVGTGWSLGQPVKSKSN